MRLFYHKFVIPEFSEFFGSSIFKPVVPIEVSTATRVAKYAALIDSGADFCIFDALIGEYLGLDIRSGAREIFGGVQEKGSAIAYLHKVLMNVSGIEYSTTVGFSYNLAQYGFGILGQKGFFDHFVVKFDLIKKEIELKPRL